MAQALPRFCPRCGTPTVAGQRFCANCGLVTSAPPLEAHYGPQATSASPFSQTQPQTPQQQPQSAWQADRSEVPFPQQPSRRKSGFIVLLLLLVVLIGAGGYVGAGLLGLHLSGFNSGAGGNTQPQVTITQIGSTLTYAGVDLTLLTVQQAESFVDDANTTTTGMLRLNMQEQNKTTAQVSWSYYDIARLLLPGKSTFVPTFVQAKVGIAPNTTQQSKIDFAVPTGTHINQLVFRLGASNEAQMDIPLTGHADLSKYAPKIVKLSGMMSYVGLDWTLVSATSQLSIVGQQASKNMLYLVLKLTIDNTLSQQAIVGSAYNYARLQAGSTTVSPKNTTLPVSFDTGEKGQTGTVTFLVPQGRTAFILIFLAQGGADRASTDFQLT